ncbi:MAG: glycosyltransferase family 9 protein [Candidatus Edwardsbacteria bacterium]
MRPKVLIIKLGAPGDVLRTTPLLKGLKKKYQNVYIVWLTETDAVELLNNNYLIDRVLKYSLESVLRLQIEKFDILLCLDKEIKATALASLVKADKKIGFGLGEEGNIFPLNASSEYAFQLGISDELKFRSNQKTYQEIIFEMAGLKYHKEPYIFRLEKEEKKFAQDFLRNKRVRAGDLLIGLNTGCGEAFATKKWQLERFCELAERLHQKLKAKVVLLGGPEERERNEEIKEKVKIPIIDTGCENTLRQFASLINCCNLIVSGDTTAMHLAIALKRPVVALFGPTCSQEIDLYGKGKKIVADVKCAPCYKAKCKKMDCMQNITVEQVFTAIGELIRR